MPRSEREVSRDFLEGDPFLFPAEVAEMMRVDPATVVRWAAAGRFPATTPAGVPAVSRTPGNHYRIRASVVRGLLDGSISWRAPDGDQD